MSTKQLTVKKLNIENLADVMKLQQKSSATYTLTNNTSSCTERAEDYMKSLDGRSSNMLGVFDGETLIAQTVYSLPHNGESRDMPEFKPEIENKDLVLYEAILVDPVYRGSSLMKRMLEYIENNALDSGRTHAIIQIAVDNPASWINALHHGMSITKVDLDPADGAKVIYLEKEISRKPAPGSVSRPKQRPDLQHAPRGKHPCGNPRPFPQNAASDKKRLSRCRSQQREQKPDLGTTERRQKQRPFLRPYVRRKSAFLYRAVFSAVPK